MRKTEFDKRAVMPTGVAAYIERKNFRANTTGCIDEFGKHWRCVDGEKISEAKFQLIYPAINPIKSKYFKGEAIGSVK